MLRPDRGGHRPDQFNLIGFTGRLFVRVSDCIGRRWVVITGLGVMALLQLFAALGGARAETIDSRFSGG
jgi:hypothetical protein